MSAGHRFAVSKKISYRGKGRATCLCLCFVRKFFAVQYRCIFCRETATLSTTSVTAKIRESFCPCNFVVSSYSKALRIPLRQDMSAGHLFAVSKINTLSRQGQGQPAFPFNPHLQASGKHLLFFGKEVIIKIINKGKRLSVEIPLTYARTE